MPLLLKFLNGVGKGGLGLIGCLTIIALILAFWFVSALIWGGVAYLVWDSAGLHHVFHAARIDYWWEAVGIGALLAIVGG